ncbi:hypothetical protein KO506_16825 [Polaribacter vadi]|uniref:hypothetical protein n=1 Tax=Polaribacter TaxID=52959 RepID=UPI001C090049|nr:MULTISPECIES: hypothetical protein [Polaribacter]MBU3013079.1 hypothetical protein [Polaribacter vadi]MDO6742898.1 hypothetical protein [Polaribacter sp. 1_MG-2023]
MKIRAIKFLKKHIILTTFIALLIVSCSDKKKSYKTQNKEQNKWINFEWSGYSIGDRYFDKAYIIIPFSIEGIPHKFQSQFDLGANETMVYGNAIRPYLNKYQNVAKKLDTINVLNKKVRGFKNINFKLDTVLFKNQHLVHFDRYGTVLTKDSVETKTIKHIGTIGANLFQNKYLIIDFPNHRIAIKDSLNTKDIEKTSFVDVKLDKGRIKVPVTINGNVKYFMFDTGASLFPLIVTKEDIKLLSNINVANDTITTSTWGEYYDVHGYKITSEIFIGDSKIETQNLNVYDSKKEFKQFFEKENVLGIMGNAFFFNKKIIIDYKNNRFGIVN